eukprot:TRINITY_DN11295_c0_g1_i1.p1 TRINITY_DN11295_c0_g1~~TRINITY_DN11295_c0_g1_i1.p1  ORF type:complete len:342 (-),score=90.88 TRINITY_DN11295_c0_g1_i1:60-1085(-)
MCIRDRYYDEYGQQSQYSVDEYSQWTCLQQFKQDEEGQWVKVKAAERWQSALKTVVGGIPFLHRTKSSITQRAQAEREEADMARAAQARKEEREQAEASYLQEQEDKRAALAAEERAKAEARRNRPWFGSEPTPASKDAERAAKLASVEHQFQERHSPSAAAPTEQSPERSPEAAPAPRVPDIAASEDFAEAPGPESGYVGSAQPQAGQLPSEAALRGHKNSGPSGDTSSTGPSGDASRPAEPAEPAAREQTGKAAPNGAVVTVSEGSQAESEAPYQAHYAEIKESDCSWQDELLQDWKGRPDESEHKEKEPRQVIWGQGQYVGHRPVSYTHLTLPTKRIV